MAKALRILTIEDKNDEDILRRKSVDVTKNDLKDEKFLELLDDLLESAKQSKDPAGGIAAPQIGINKRAFYILNYDTDIWELFINPEIEPVGFSKMSIKEACLSVPNIEEKVLRYKNIKIKYLDKKGNLLSRKLKDLNAITAQHEKDHLDGILFIDKIEK